MMLVSERGRMARKLLMEHDGGKNIRMSLLFMISRILLAILTYGRCGTHTPEEGGAVDLFLTVYFVLTFVYLKITSIKNNFNNFASLSVIYLDHIRPTHIY